MTWSPLVKQRELGLPPEMVELMAMSGMGHAVKTKPEASVIVQSVYHGVKWLK